MNVKACNVCKSFGSVRKNTQKKNDQYILNSEKNGEKRRQVQMVMPRRLGFFAAVKCNAVEHYSKHTGKLSAARFTEAK